MKLDKTDLQNASNLIKLITRAKFELQGIEVLGVAESMRWLSRLQSNIEKELSPSPESIKPVESPMKATQEPPKPSNLKGKGRKSTK